MSGQRLFRSTKKEGKVNMFKNSNSLNSERSIIDYRVYVCINNKERERKMMNLKGSKGTMRRVEGKQKETALRKQALFLAYASLQSSPGDWR